MRDLISAPLHLNCDRLPQRQSAVGADWGCELAGRALTCWGDAPTARGELHDGA